MIKFWSILVLTMAFAVAANAQTSTPPPEVKAVSAPEAVSSANAEPALSPGLVQAQPFGNGTKYPRVSPAALSLGQVAPLDPGPGKMWQFNGGVTYQPMNELRTSFSLTSQKLTRYDTGRTAFQLNILNGRATYQFTKATFARVILDYSTINSRLRTQALFGWTPSPGTAFYVGYNDDLNYDFLHPYTGQVVPGFRRYSRVFFVKLSYVIRRSFGS